jgi:hypothetical protein
MNGIELYESLAKPPKEALRTITGGRLSGFTDVNPQWRYRAMTEKFGLCGIGWKFEIVRLWNEPASDGQIFAWAQINVYIKQNDSWSDPIPGVGGNFLLEKESRGLHCNDEAYKMAITDALGNALKMLGVAAAIHEGKWDGDKYSDEQDRSPQPVPQISPEMAQAKLKALELKDKIAYSQLDFENLLRKHGGVKDVASNKWKGIDWIAVVKEMGDLSNTPIF